MSSYYQLLEIPVTADDNTVKTAFRRVSLKHHPDRGGDAEMFKKVNKAYQTLRAPELRKAYDELHGKYGDEWEQVHKQREAMANHQYNREDVIIVKLSTELSDLFQDQVVKQTVERRTICRPCDGSGYPGAKYTTCLKCHGVGAVGALLQGMIPVQTQCPECKGMKRSLDKGSCQACGACDTRGYKVEEHELTCTIYAGTPNNYSYLYNQAGHELKEDLRAPVIVTVCHNKDKTGSSINRVGNIFQDVNIQLDQALGLRPIHIESLQQVDGKQVVISFTTDETIMDKSELVLEGYGVTQMYKFPRGSHSPELMDAPHTGVLVLQFRVSMPSTHAVREIRENTGTLAELLASANQYDRQQTELTDSTPAPEPSYPDDRYSVVNVSASSLQSYGKWSQAQDLPGDDSNAVRHNINDTTEMHHNMEHGGHRPVECMQM